MNKATWLIQSNIVSYSNQLELIHAIGDAGIDFKEVTVVPFSGDYEIHGEVEGLHIIPYGSCSFVKRIMDTGWKGLFFDEDLFRTSHWKLHHQDLLNHNARFGTIAEVAEILKGEDPASLWFVKPDNDLKTFAGEVVVASEFAEWADKVSFGNYVFDSTCPAVLAEPTLIHKEWRFFVIGGKVVDGSLYQHHKRMRKAHVEEGDEILTVAQKFADIWLPAECVVMDLAETDEGIKLIEFNCINGSGFYDHDVAKIASALTRWVETK